jgi:hypothetical protein
VAKKLAAHPVRDFGDKNLPQQRVSRVVRVVRREVRQYVDRTNELRFSCELLAVFPSAGLLQ